LDTNLYFYHPQQYRIFPYLAAACVQKIATEELTITYMEIIARSQADSNGFDILVGCPSNLTCIQFNVTIISDPECCRDSCADLLVEASDHVGS